MDDEDTNSNAGQGGNNSEKGPPRGRPVDPNPKRQPGEEAAYSEHGSGESVLHKIEPFAAVALVIITGAYTVFAGLTLKQIQDQTTASTTAANAAKSAADTAHSALNEQQSEAKANSAALNRQLQRLDKSIAAANRLADAATQTALIAQRQLVQLQTSVAEQRRLADATATNVGLAANALRDEQENFSEQERPIVVGFMLPMTIDLAHNQLQGNLLWENFGRTPAVRVATDWGFVSDQVNVVRRIDVAYPGFAKHGKANTGGTIIPPLSGGGVPFANPIVLQITSPTWMSYFSTHDNLIVIFGHVVYYDVHGRRPYETYVCLAVHPDGKITYCQHHNYMT